jgi:CheY-like chemotaxis protein
MYHKPTILIADDSETFVMYLATILHRMNFHPIQVHDGVEALKMTKTMKPDVVILDIDMPRINGKGVLKSVKEDPETSTIPVIMLTIRGDDTTIDDCRKLKCSGFITKPVNSSQLYEVVNGCIGKSNEKRREFMRVAYNEKILLSYAGVSSLHDAVNISEGGLFCQGDMPILLSEGSEVSVDLPLNSDDRLHLKGSVVYTGGAYGRVMKGGPGIAIKFKQLSEKDTKILRDYVTKQIETGLETEH